MTIVYKQITPKDLNAARQFAIKGMHLSWYVNNQIELYFYSWYFLYSEILQATIAIGAFVNGELVGMILGNMDKAPKLFKSRRWKCFVKVVGFIVRYGFEESSNPYNEANQKMLANYQNLSKIDGELNFFAVNPDVVGKGIGTNLLNEFERQIPGKTIYLYTDSGSTYQFYEHRGFNQVGQMEIELPIKGKKTAMTCMLFAKTIR
ncbi:N-acetyltransferase [Lentilactobacillus fungorum]|uniref:N-acetyltransferase n=1 Tax=Lentilactobacillus fungorum TaxID=2201250 RepID=A0ABQ3W1W5_9LACO|nr:GNAT family N-acetyltransferase [Lentilactobacillus fungorum]GHP14432.1 N-acetyltransferase [Lentilactobacillus fungorum]